VISELKRVLVVAAHPDDEVLGCGATMSLLSHQGKTVFVLLLSKGRIFGTEDPIKYLQDIGVILNLSSIKILEFPDNEFDSVPLLDIINEIEKVIGEIRPDAVITHWPYDLNVDHQLTSMAVRTAVRPVHEENVKRLLYFPILSSTEWSMGEEFKPNFAFNVGGSNIEKKIEAMKIYKSELRAFPHPRSIEGIRIQAQWWGMRFGCESAEAFEIGSILI